jgi:DNA-binding transcriptional regulator PaaX
VVGDAQLKLLDIRVYCMLAGSVRQGNTARIGTRLLAVYVGASRRLVVESLQRLERQGHLHKAARHGQRQMYVLTSPVFGQKQRAGIEEVISSPSRTPRLASVRSD